jgi:hypothetical protein
MFKHLPLWQHTSIAMCGRYALALSNEEIYDALQEQLPRMFDHGRPRWERPQDYRPKWVVRHCPCCPHIEVSLTLYTAITTSRRDRGAMIETM